VFELFFRGMLLGVPAVFLMGPVLLTILQGALRHGFLAGFAAALGIAVSDILCIFLCYIGLSQVLKHPSSQFYFGWIGGVLLIVFGLATLLNNSPPKASDEGIQTKEFMGWFTKGFLVNFVNPFVFVYWIMAIGLLDNQYGATPLKVTVFFAGSIFVIFTTDVIKAFLAKQVRPFIKTEVYHWINRMFGILLCGIGGYFIWYTMTKL